MRIIRVAHRLPPWPGGLEVHVRELTLEQVRLGAEVELLYGEGEAPPRTGVKAHQVSELPAGVRRWWPAHHRFAWDAARHRSPVARPVDVVHGHGDYAIAWAAARLARRYRCPAILTVHGGLSERPVHRLLARGIFPRLGHIIAVSDDVAGQLRRRGVPADRLSVISSGIHCVRYEPAPTAKRDALRAALEVPPGGNCLIALGRLHPVKGFQHLIEAAPLLRSRFPGLRILIVGDGPEGERLRRLAVAYPEVRLLGAQAAPRVAELLGAADLFVLPSVDLGRQREGTPTSIMEAMAAGLPVVATRTGGIPGLVQHGVNGMLVPPADSAALAQAITHLLGDLKESRQMGRRNQERVRELDWAAVARRVMDVYVRVRKGHLAQAERLLPLPRLP
jgi:glycogen(starch) synthase